MIFLSIIFQYLSSFDTPVCYFKYQQKTKRKSYLFEIRKNDKNGTRIPTYQCTALMTISHLHSVTNLVSRKVEENIASIREKKSYFHQSIWYHNIDVQIALFFQTQQQDVTSKITVSDRTLPKYQPCSTCTYLVSRWVRKRTIKVVSTGFPSAGQIKGNLQK